MPHVVMCDWHDCKLRAEYRDDMPVPGDLKYNIARCNEHRTGNATERAIAMTLDNPMAATVKTPAERLAACIDANVPVLLMGAPGTAKTSIIERLAAERGAYLEVLIASAQDPTTILGIPMPTEDRKHTEPTVPGWARRIIEHDAAGEDTMLFLDELTTVPPSVAAPLLGIVQSRRADGWTLPAKTRIIAAANPPDLAVGGWTIEPAMANRWAHIDWPVPHAEWIAWARQQASPSLQAFADYLETVPAQLLAVPTGAVQRSGAWPSPRSWTRAAELVDATGDWMMAALTVGEAAAQTMAGWMAKRDVPTVDDMLSGARPVPTRADAFATAIDALATAVNGQTLARTFELLTANVGTDPYVVAKAVQRIALQWRQSGNTSAPPGLAPVLAACKAAGVVLS